MPGGREAVHVNADFGNDHLSRALIYPGDLVQPLLDLGKRAHLFLDFRIRPSKSGAGFRMLLLCGYAAPVT